MKEINDPKVRAVADELSKYSKALERYEDIYDRYLGVCARLNSIGSPTLTDMPKGGTPPSMEDQVARKVELEDRLKMWTDRLNEYLHETYRIIDHVCDPVNASILEWFYIDGMTMDGIADRLHYSKRQTERRFHQALADAIPAVEPMSL